MANKQAMLMKEVWVGVETPFRFTESIDPKTGDKKFILKGLMLPFDKISRNNVLYNADSVKEKHKQLIGKPVMYNHKVDGDELPKGHFTDSYVTEEGWMYEADIDPEEKDMIRKLERGDLRHVSIQLIGGKVEEKTNAENMGYTEAWVSDVIEGSVVPAPGFLDTTASFAEALGHKPKKFPEQVSLNANDTISESVVGELGEKETLTLMEGCDVKKEEIDIDQLQKGMSVEKGEHPDLDDEAIKSLVEDHLKEDPLYYDKEDEGCTKKEEIEDEADSDGVVIGDEVTVKKSGKVGQIVDMYEDNDVTIYMIQLEDGQKEKLCREDISTSTGSGAIAPAKLPEPEQDIDEILNCENAMNLLKEFVYKLGDTFVVPFGISGVPVAKYVGQVGMVVGVDEKSYTILFQDGKKIKMERDLVDISVVE